MAKRPVGPVDDSGQAHRSSPNPKNPSFGPAPDVNPGGVRIPGHATALENSVKRERERRLERDTLAAPCP